jgi:signal transduction histidine kinase
MIAVTGAEGPLGSLVLEGLRKAVAPDHLVALVRHPERAAGLVAQAIRVRPADHSSPETLALALTGVKRLLLISEGEAGQQVQDHRALIDAAKAAGAEFIAYASMPAAGSSTLPIVGHELTEELLRSSGIPFVILRFACCIGGYTNNFGTQLASGAFDSAARRVETAAYAAAAVAVLMTDGRHDGGNRDLAADLGPTLRVSGAFGMADATPARYHTDDAHRVDQIRLAGQLRQHERMCLVKGSGISAFVGSALLDESPRQSIVLDFKEPRKAQAVARESEGRHHEMQLDMVHANRVATMGQLTSSIAHEVCQSIGAVAINGGAALNWLSQQPPDIEEARMSIEQIVRDAERSSEVIARIRELVKKAPPLKQRLDLNEAVREVIVLTRSEAIKNRISVQTQLAEHLPPTEGDRVQLRQVLLNLIVNAIQAMASGAGGARDLRVTTGLAGSNGALVRVADSGPGLDAQALERIFDPYYTTKPEGLGVGLAICRSIIDAHGGRLSASANKPRGAVFQFTLPAH